MLGLSLNAPFGLTTKPENRYWAGFTARRPLEIKTYNLQTALAYRVAPGLIVGAGVQVELIEGKLQEGLAARRTYNAASPNAAVEADDIAVGFTAGVLWNPNAGTIDRSRLPLVYRSRSGGLAWDRRGAGGPAGVTANVKTPETVTLSLRQALTRN